MNRKNFGELIETLRNQTAFMQLNNKPFTQKEMADKLGITLRNYGRLERGEVVNLNGDLLMRLADAFQLLSRERYQLFYAAGGVSQYFAESKSDSLDQLISNLKHLISRSDFPTFIIDVYGNVVMSSSEALPIVGVTTDEALALKYPNVLWAMLTQDLSHAYLQEDLIKMMMVNLALIRSDCLRYRGTEYCRTLFSELAKYPQFIAAWQLVSANRGIQIPANQVFKHYHPQFDTTFHYFSTGSQIITPWGELTAITFSPTEEKTFFKFKELMHSPLNRPVLLAPHWPNYPLPDE